MTGRRYAGLALLVLGAVLAATVVIGFGWNVLLPAGVVLVLAGIVLTIWRG